MLVAGLTAKLQFTSAAAGYRITAADGPTVFYSMTEGGFDRDAPKTAIKEGVELIHTLEDESGKEVSQVALGDEVNLHLRVRSLVPNATLYNVAIVDMLPSGFEL